MLPINPRELQRQLKQLKRMGLRFEALEGVKRVVIEFDDHDIVIESPQVFTLEMSGQKMFYVTGVSIREEKKTIVKELESTAIPTTAITISEDDVRFIVEYTGVSEEEARKALEEAHGDIARAIEIIQSRRSKS